MSFHESMGSFAHYNVIVSQGFLSMTKTLLERLNAGIKWFTSEDAEVRHKLPVTYFYKRTLLLNVVLLFIC